jgi:hypothetical protein
MICAVDNEGIWAFAVSFANRHPLMVIGALFVLLSSISNLSTKKVKVKTNYHMSMWFFLAGLGCMGLDLWQSNSLPIKSHKEKPPINTVQVNADLKRKVENYMEALETHEYSRVSPFYPSVLDSYFGEDKVSFGHVWRRMRQDWRKIAKEKFEVLWNTWKYRLDEANERHIVSFSFKRKYLTDEKESVEKEEDKSIEFTFDRNYKIFKVDKPVVE